MAVAVSGRRCVDQAGGRCVGGGVPRGGQRAHAGNGRPRRLGQETALRPAPLSVPGAGRTAAPVWLRLGRFPRCGCQGSGLFPSQPAPHRRGAQRSSSSPGSSPSSASVCGSLRHLRGKQVPRAGSRPPFPRGCRSLAVLAGLPRWPQGHRGADGLALSLVSGHTRGFCQDCDGALRCPQEPFATPSPRDFLVCRAFLSGDAAGLRRAACTATEALRGAHSSWFYGRVYWVSHVEPSSRPCAEPRSVAVSGAVSPWPTRLAVPGRGFPRLPRETCSSLRRLRPSFPCCGDTSLAVWVTMGLLWYFVVVF